MIKKLSFILLLGCFKGFTQGKIQTPPVNSVLRFTENLGQWGDHILFKAQLDGGALFMEKNALLFNFYNKEKYRSLHHGGVTKDIYKDDMINCHCYRISFENCNNSLIEKLEQGKDYENYFLGSDQKFWNSGVKNYRHLWYRNIYDRIDYEITSAANGFKYNFHVTPHGNPSAIKLKYEGVNNMTLVNGTLVYSLSVGSVVEQKPFAYQLIDGMTREVECNYILKNNVLSFDFPNGYNLNYNLVIDPILVFAAQSGSTADNFGMTATLDSQGNFYSGGTCFNVGYPTTLGAYSISFNGTSNQGLTDVVISKYNSAGNSLLFSTYLGGTAAEIVTSLIVDHEDNLCLFGATGSFNFPTTINAYDVSYNSGPPLSFLFNGTYFTSGTDIFVSKFNSAGTNLIASTFLGGSDNDGVNHVNHLTPLSSGGQEYMADSLQFNYGDQYRGEIQIDLANNIYITSSTRSGDFPVTPNAFDNSLGGKQDAIAAKFNPSLSLLMYSTYLGGSYNDCGNSLIVDENQEVYITGGTSSSNFPTTINAYKYIYGGGKADGYISHLNTISGALLQSTYIGTGNYDQSYFIQSDNNSNIYVFGQSLGNMPVTGLPYYNPNTHQFISQLDNSLSYLNMSTVIGSNTNGVDISPSAFSVDGCGNIYLSGWGGDIFAPASPSFSNMPLLFPTMASTDGHDFYLMILSNNAGSLLYGSFFGGPNSHEHVDGGTSRIDKNGIFYQSVCAGCGGFDDFPVTPGAWPNTPGDQNHSANCNNGIFKIDAQTPIAVSNIVASYSGCLPVVANLNSAYLSSNSIYKWYLGNGITSSSVAASVTYTNAGTYTVSLVVNNSNTCNQKDSSSIIVIINPTTPTVNISSSDNFSCPGQFISLTANGANSYTWSTGVFSNIMTANPFTTTTYTVVGSTLNNCSSSASINQSVTICESLKENKYLTDKFKIYPNPNTGQFQIIGNPDFDDLSIEIYNTVGQLIEKVNVNTSDKIINLTGKEKGIYFLKIYHKRDFVSSQKVIIQP